MSRDTHKDERFRRFVLAKFSGSTNREAAILAGYKPTSASAVGSRLAKEPSVLSMLAKMESEAAARAAVYDEQAEGLPDKIPYTREAAQQKKQEQTPPDNPQAENALPNPASSAVFRGHLVDLYGTTYDMTDPKDALTLNMLGVISMDKQQQDSAKALINYYHSKVESLGKKGAQAEAARDAVKGRFTPMPPPALKDKKDGFAVAGEEVTWQ